MEILQRKQVGPLHVITGDSLRATYKPADGDEQVLAETIITAQRAMIVDEVVLFADHFEGRRALGGMFVEAKA